jgi:hypothetical protein
MSLLHPSSPEFRINFFGIWFLSGVDRTVPEQPIVEVRWAVEGFPFTFAREAQAKAFAPPGRRVYQLQREVPLDSRATLEWTPGEDD